MAKRGGYSGQMPGNMNNLMKQAQRMQRQIEQQQKELEEKQKELEEKEYTASAGGGAVTLTMNGKKEILSLAIEPEVVDPDDVEMLQDLIIAAFNEAGGQVNKDIEENLGVPADASAGGMGSLGGMPF